MRGLFLVGLDQQDQRAGAGRIGLVERVQAGDLGGQGIALKRRIHCHCRASLAPVVAPGLSVAVGIGLNAHDANQHASGPRQSP